MVTEKDLEEYHTHLASQPKGVQDVVNEALNAVPETASRYEHTDDIYNRLCTGLPTRVAFTVSVLDNMPAPQESTVEKNNLAKHKLARFVAELEALGFTLEVDMSQTLKSHYDNEPF